MQRTPPPDGAPARPGPAASPSDGDVAQREAIRQRIVDLGGIETSDDRELFSGLLRSLVERGPESFSELEGAVRRHDAAGLQASAHSLKGSVANLGGTGLATLLDELETQGREGRMPLGPDELAELRAEFAMLSRSLCAVADELDRARP